MRGINTCISRGHGGGRDEGDLEVLFKARFGFMVSVGVLNEFLDHLNSRWEMKGKKLSLVEKLVGRGNRGFSSK